MSTSLSATQMRFSPWPSQTTRGRVWRLIRTPSCPPARRKAPPCPATRRRVHTWLKEASSASRDWCSLTATHIKFYSLAAPKNMRDCKQETELQAVFAIFKNYTCMVTFHLLKILFAKFWFSQKLKIRDSETVLKTKVSLSL